MTFQIFEPTDTQEINPEQEMQTTEQIQSQGNFQVTEPKGWEVPKEIQRRLSRYTNRAIEEIGGTPGNIVDLVKSFGEAPEEQLNPIQKFGKKFLETFPTSEELRARSAEKFPELEPKSEFEELEDEAVSDVGMLINPLYGGMKLVNAIGSSLVGNLGKKFLKEIGVGPTGQEIGKLGLMVFSGLFKKGGGIKNYISKQYDMAKSSISKGEMIRYNQSPLTNLSKNLRKGIVTDAEKPILEAIEEFTQKIQNGLIAVEEVVEFDRGINRLIRNTPKADKMKIGNLKQLKKSNMQTIDQYAKNNPTFDKHWKEAKLAYSGIAESEAVQNWIKSNVGLKDGIYAASLLGLGESVLRMGENPQSLMPFLTKVAAGTGIVYAGEVAKRLATNPALRRYYALTLSSAVQKNKAKFLRNFNAMNRVAKKEFEKESPSEN